MTVFPPKTPTATSLQARLAVRLLAVFVFAFVASGLATFLISRADDTDIPDESLLRNFDDVRKYIEEDSDGVWLVDPARLPPSISFILRLADGTEIQRGGDATILAAIDRMAPPQLVSNMPAGAINMYWWTDPATENGYYLISRGVRNEGRAALLELAQMVTPTESGLYALLDEWLGEFVPVGIPLLAVLVVALTLSLRSALRPLEKLRRLAGRIGPHQTGLRLPVEELPQELHPPVLAINRALDRLDHGFRCYGGRNGH